VHDLPAVGRVVVDPVAQEHLQHSFAIFHKKSDQIGRIFAYWVIVYLGYYWKLKNFILPLKLIQEIEMTPRGENWFYSGMSND
jgi:hypothetical protein